MSTFKNVNQQSNEALSMTSPRRSMSQFVNVDSEFGNVDTMSVVATLANSPRSDGASWESG